MPFIETQCRNNAAVASFPGLAKVSAARQTLDRGIEAAAPGESPSHHHPRSPAVVGANHGDRLSRNRVEIRRKSPSRAYESEFALYARRSRADIAPAHFESLRRGKIRVRNG